MKSTAENLANWYDKLDKLSTNSPVIYTTGYFEFLNVSDSEVDEIISSLNNIPDVKYIYFKRIKDNDWVIRGILRTDDNFNDVDINEEVIIHDKLNQNIWDENNELKEEVREKIKEIVDVFIQQLKEDNIELRLSDIWLLGSNANYNYTDESDLDIHLIADESFDCSEEHLQIIYNAYKSLFNSKYDITIKGINVELYVENADKLSNVSTGVYSLEKGWLKKPAQYDIPKIDDEAVDKEVDKWENKYFELIKNSTTEKIENYIDEIYKIRQDSISKEGEFGLGNLVFKEIRRRGYLDDLKGLKNKLLSKELSLN